jgi:outer membrane protein assembly factor BamB
MRYILSFFLIVGSALAENWPAWRGPTGDGISNEKGIPTHWSETENIAWKATLPGEGHSSPIIWNQHVFVTAYLSTNEERVLLCLDRQTGNTLWQRVVLKSPPESIHRLNSRASGTPTTDGQLIYVTFMRITGDEVVAPNVGGERMITAGKAIVAAYDFDGNLVWKTEIGDFISAHGYNACPVLHEDLVIINGDHDGDAYIVALDKHSGKQRWKTPRENRTRSYVTPIIREIDGRTQMILSGSLSVASYDPSNGKRHWVMDGPTEQFVASMVYNGKYLFVTGGYPDHHILAIRPDGHGKISDSHIAWRTKRGASYVPSPILAGPYFLIVADSGIASCFNANSGERHWMERLPSGHSASPVLADGNVYFVSNQGITTVIRPGTEFDVISKNEIGEPVSASPAISEGQIFIRGDQHLFCIGMTKKK